MERESRFIFCTLLSANTDGALPIGRCRQAGIHLPIWSGSLICDACLFPIFQVFVCSTVSSSSAVLLEDFSFSPFTAAVLSSFWIHPFQFHSSSFIFSTYFWFIAFVLALFEWDLWMFLYPTSEMKYSIWLHNCPWDQHIRTLLFNKIATTNIGSTNVIDGEADLGCTTRLINATNKHYSNTEVTNVSRDLIVSILTAQPVESGLAWPLSNQDLRPHRYWTHPRFLAL